MKQIASIIIILSTYSISWAQFGQIGNGGFESWQDDPIYEYPVDWESSNTAFFLGTSTAHSSTDAYAGNFSAHLETAVVGNDTIGGMVYQGVADQSGPISGIPYTDNFEAVRLAYKCDLQQGDSLYLIMARFNNSTLVSFNLIPFATGSVSIWTQNIVYVGNILADELFIGFIVGGFNAAPQPSSWAMIDEIELLTSSITTTPIPNNGFENWMNETVENPSNWYTINNLLSPQGITNVVKSTDAYSGTYAAELETVYAGDTIAAVLSKGLIDFGNPIPFSPAPYNGSPTEFSGAYKYSPVNNDQAWIQIEFYEQGVPCGVLYEIFNSAQNYTTFNSPLTLTGTPDSMLFIAFSGMQPGSKLLLDELEFGGGNVGIHEYLANDFALFPNPAESLTVIEFPDENAYTVKLFNIDGKLVYQGYRTSGKHEIIVDNFESGTYLLNISNSNSTVQKRLIIR